MKASILYLYYDFMNLYGDNGNVRIMEKRLQDQGFDVEITRKTVTDDDISFEGFDLIYCGSGTESRRTAAVSSVATLTGSPSPSVVSMPSFLYLAGNQFPSSACTPDILTPVQAYARSIQCVPISLMARCPSERPASNRHPSG